MPSSYSIIYSTKHGHLIDIWPHNFVNKLTSMCKKHQKTLPSNCLQTGFFWQLWRLCWFWLLRLLSINDTRWGWYASACIHTVELWPPFSCTSLLSVSWTSAPSVLSTSSIEGHDSCSQVKHQSIAGQVDLIFCDKCEQASKPEVSVASWEKTKIEYRTDNTYEIWNNRANKHLGTFAVSVYLSQAPESWSSKNIKWPVTSNICTCSTIEYMQSRKVQLSSGDAVDGVCGLRYSEKLFGGIQMSITSSTEG